MRVSVSQSISPVNITQTHQMRTHSKLLEVARNVWNGWALSEWRWLQTEQLL